MNGSELVSRALNLSRAKNGRIISHPYKPKSKPGLTHAIPTSTGHGQAYELPVGLSS